MATSSSASPCENLLRETYFQIPPLFNENVINNVVFRAVSDGVITKEEGEQMKRYWTDELLNMNVEPPLIHEGKAFFEEGLESEYTVPWQEEKIGELDDEDILAVDLKHLCKDIQRGQQPICFYSNFATDHIIEAQQKKGKGAICNLNGREYIFSGIKLDKSTTTSIDKAVEETDKVVQSFIKTEEEHQLGLYLKEI